jgi:large subunit ribosomal protein L35
MPKMKTHSGAKKRFRKTATGKIRGRYAFSTHILEKKSPKRKRQHRKPKWVSDHDRETVRKLLGGRKGA